MDGSDEQKIVVNICIIFMKISYSTEKDLTFSLQNASLNAFQSSQVHYFFSRMRNRFGVIHNI